MGGRTIPPEFLHTDTAAHASGGQTIESEQRLRAIVDGAVDAIVTIDDRGIIESVNPSTERLFGYARHELVGRNVSMLMPSPYREEHDEYLRRYLATGHARIIGIGRELIGRRKDGQTFPLHLSISEVHLEKGRLFTAIIHDISERRRLERQVLEAVAEEQRRMGRELHDGVCQNLVGAALGISVLARQLALNSPAAAADAERLAELVRRTAAQARDLSHGLAPLDVSAEGLTTALRKLAQQVTETSGVECTFDDDPEAAAAIAMQGAGTANHLYRIVQEAVSNAIRHGRSTRVQVAVSAAGREELVLNIRDNGRGFPRRPGRGLGLQTMAYRARMIGGAISVGAANGGGTIVTCNLHRLPAPQEPERPQHGGRRPRTGRDGVARTLNTARSKRRTHT
jgi:two-component system, LuxR family, sensor kinase FixL